MNQSITNVTSHFTPAASLAAVGVLLQKLKVFEPIEQGVNSKQKTIKYSPTQKLFDSFITLLAGAHGMVEMNTLLRADPTLQAAFGREACAEQSVAQQTLDACTAENVTQMEQAMKQIVRQHSQAFRHNYQQGWQILDVDLSGWLCGKQAAFATKGYFAGAPRNRRGRQVGRDKQGLGLTKRNKKRFEAQQVLLLLGSLAHNVVVWARSWLTSQEEETATPPLLLHYGILRMVRDVFHISGSLSFDASGKVVQIQLNQDAFLAHLILPSLRHLLFPMHVAISLGKN